MAIERKYEPTQRVNIGPGKDDVNDFARKYNLEIENIYDLLNKYTVSKVVFYGTSSYWSSITGGYRLSLPHNGNIVFAVYKTISTTESEQVLVGVSMNATNVMLESVTKFDGFMLYAAINEELGITPCDPAVDANAAAIAARDYAREADAIATALTNIYNEAIASGQIVAPAVDPTLTISGAAADSKVTGDAVSDLNQAIFEEKTTAFEQGGLISASGATTGSSVQIRTEDYLPIDEIAFIKADSSYRFRPYCYASDDTYLGYYYDGAFYNVASEEMLTTVLHNVDETLSAMGVAKIKLIAVHLDSSNHWQNIIPSESSNIHIFDSVLAETQKAVVKEVIDASVLPFVQGGLSSSTGEYVGSNIQIVSNYIDVNKLWCGFADSNYKFRIFCYGLDGTYLGYYYCGNLYNTASDTRLTNELSDISTKLTRLGASKVRIVGTYVLSGYWHNIYPTDSNKFHFYQRYLHEMQDEIPNKVEADIVRNVEYHYKGVEIDTRKAWFYRPTSVNEWAMVPQTEGLNVFVSENLLKHKTNTPMYISYKNENGDVTRRVFAKLEGNDYWSDYGMSGYVNGFFGTMIPSGAVDIRIYPNSDDSTSIANDIDVDIIPISKEWKSDRFTPRTFMDIVKSYSSTNLPSSNSYASSGKLSQIYDALDALVASYPSYISKTVLGKDQTGTYEIREYHLVPETVGYNNIQSGYPETKNEVKLPLFLIDSCIHGNEQLATVIVTEFIKNLCTNWQSNEDFEFFRWNVEFRIIPVVNPWGFNNNSRYTSENLDINRQFLKNDATLESECIEALILRDWLVKYRDDAFNYVDCHTIPWASGTRDIAWLISPNNEIDDMSNSVITKLSRIWKSKYPFITYDGLMGYVGKALYINDSIYNSQGREYAYYYLGYKNAITLEIADTVTYNDEPKFGALTTNMYMDIFMNTLLAFAQGIGADYIG